MLLGCLMALLAHRQQSNAHIALSMCDLNADYKLHAGSGAGVSSSQSNGSSVWATIGQQPIRIANWLIGTPLAKNLKSLRLDEMNSTDQQLEFLSELDGLEELELLSDRATDRTISQISSLPNLKRLKLGGRQFTVNGLLKLRDSKTLEALIFETPRLSDIEEAVVMAELPFDCQEAAFLPEAVQTQAAPTETVEMTAVIPPYEI